MLDRGYRCEFEAEVECSVTSLYDRIRHLQVASLSLASERVDSTHMERDFFGDSGKSRRAINLGGASTTASYASIIDSVKARREERQNAVKRFVLTHN